MPTFYISPSGNSAYDGLSESSPWPFAKLADFRPAPGDRVLLQGGATFPGFIDWSWKGIGDPNKPVTLGSYGVGHATIASPPDHGAFYYAGPGGVRLESLILKGRSSRYGPCGATFGPTDGPEDNLRNVALRDCDISGYGTAGVMLCGRGVDRPARSVLLENCRLHKNGLGTYLWAVDGLNLFGCVGSDNDGYPGNPGGNAGQGLTVYASRNVKVERCRAENNGHQTPFAVGSAGFYFATCERVQVSHSWAVGNGDQERQDGQNFILYGCKDSSIAECVALDGLAGFCLFHDRWSGGPVERCVIADCLALGNVTDISIVGDVFNSDIVNNRVVCTGYKAVDVADSDGLTRRNLRVSGNRFELRGGQFLLEAVPGLRGVEGLTNNTWTAEVAQPFLVRQRGFAKIVDALAAEPAGV